MVGVRVIESSKWCQDNIDIYYVRLPESNQSCLASASAVSRAFLPCQAQSLQSPLLTILCVTFPPCPPRKFVLFTFRPQS